MKNSVTRKTLAMIIGLSLIVPALWFAAKLISPKEDSSSQVQAAQKVFIDPVTGEFLEGPTGQEAPTETARAATAAGASASTSDEGLVETLSPVENGGIIVDLEGRFRTPLTVEVGEDGKSILTHETVDRAAADENEGQE